MSGQKSASGNPRPGRDVHNAGSDRPATAAFHSGRSESDSGAGMHHAASGPNWSGSLGAAQQRWPEYNRIIIAATAGSGAAILAAVIVRAVTG